MARTILVSFVVMLGIYIIVDLFYGDTTPSFVFIGFWSGLIGLALSESIEESKSSD